MVNELTLEIALTQAVKITKTAIILPKIDESCSNFQGIVTITAPIQTQSNGQDCEKSAVKIGVFYFFKDCSEVKIDQTPVIFSEKHKISSNNVQKNFLV